MKRFLQWWWCGIVAVLLNGRLSVMAQIDPEQRHLLQLGFNQPLEGRGPMAGYAFYYMNHPSFIRSNLTLRLAIAPTYLDSELGIRGVFGEHTDLGLGLAGGGFADTYSEVKQGVFRREESFTGHGGELSASLYHLFNPDQMIPLHAIFRITGHHASYVRDATTDPAFTLPHDRSSFHMRSGIRWGGREPLMFPSMAMELSAWHEVQVRGNPGAYGFAGDREIEPVSHTAWARGLLAYTLPKSQQYFSVSVTGGTSVHPDRFSAYRLGGSLPLVAEFPLSLPGYYFQELSARGFVLFNVMYALPLDPGHHWEILGFSGSAYVKHLPGLEQSPDWHNGVGGAIAFRPGSRAWQLVAGYGYGIDATRSHGRGGHNIGILVQYDFEKGGPLLRQGVNPMKWRGFDRLFGR